MLCFGGHCPLLKSPSIQVCLLHDVSCVAILPYLAGCSITMLYYHDSSLGYTFLVGEFMFVESYIFFLMSCLAPRVEPPSQFSILKWFLYLIAPTMLMLLVQDEFIHHTSRLREQWTVGMEHMLHFGELPFRWEHKGWFQSIHQFDRGHVVSSTAVTFN